MVSIAKTEYLSFKKEGKSCGEQEEIRNWTLRFWVWRFRENGEG